MSAENKKLPQRNKFTPEEDQILRELVQKHGFNDWSVISASMPNRSARQCRERYKNYLAPELTNGHWSEEEDNLLLLKYQEFGPKWAQISKFFPSRSEVNIKNRYSHLLNKQKKKILRVGNDLFCRRIIPQPFIKQELFRSQLFYTMLEQSVEASSPEPEPPNQPSFEPKVSFTPQELESYAEVGTQEQLPQFDLDFSPEFW